MLDKLSSIELHPQPLDKTFCFFGFGFTSAGIKGVHAPPHPASDKIFLYQDVDLSQAFLCIFFKSKNELTVYQVYECQKKRQLTQFGNNWKQLMSSLRRKLQQQNQDSEKGSCQLLTEQD